MTSAEFKAWRKRLGLTQQGAGDAIGRTKRTIISYEKGIESHGRPAPVPLTVELACKWVEHSVMDEFEADVIEAAQDLVNDYAGSEFGPMKRNILRSTDTLIDAVMDLQAENDGRWQRPADTQVVTPQPPEE